MIKVNLLGGLRKSSSNLSLDDNTAGFDIDEISSEDQEIGQKEGLKKLLMILILPILLFAYEKYSLSMKEKERNTLQVKLNQLVAKNEEKKDLAQEIEKYQTQKESLTQQVNTIENLSKGRLLNVRILDTIQKLMPEKSWLSNVKVQDYFIELEGYASNDSYVSELIGNLEKNIYFSQVDLKRSAEEKLKSGGSVKRYNIQAKIERQL